MIIIKDMAELEAQIKIGTFEFPDTVDLHVLTKKTACRLLAHGFDLQLEESGRPPYITIELFDVPMLESGDLKLYVTTDVAQCLPKASFPLVQVTEIFYSMSISIESLKKVLSQQ